MNEATNVFEAAKLNPRPTMTEIFANIGPVEANELFSIREMHDIAMTCKWRAEQIVNSTEYEGSKKAGLRATLAYETIKQIRAVKQARLDAVE